MFTTSSCAFLPVPPFLSSSVIYWLLTSLHLLLLETSWVWFQWFQSCALSLSSFNPSSPLLINTPTLQALLLPGLPKEDSKKQQLKTPTLPQMQRPPCRTVGWCSRPPTPLRGLPRKVSSVPRIVRIHCDSKKGKGNCPIISSPNISVEISHLSLK